jgi:hypothetical protein
MDPHFLDLSTSWRRVVSYTNQPLYPQGKSPVYPLNRGLGGPQSWFGGCRKEEVLTQSGLELLVIQPVPEAILTALP